MLIDKNTVLFLLCPGRKQQPYLLLDVPSPLLCAVPEGGSEELGALWPPALQAAHCRPPRSPQKNKDG